MPEQAAPARSPGQRASSALSNWGRYELRLWRPVFSGPAPYALLLALLLLFVLAWQVPFSYSFNADDELHLDQPFLKNFNAPEKAPNGPRFRWSKNEGSLDFPGIGKRSYRLQLNIAAGPNPNRHYVLYANKTKIAEAELNEAPQTYTFDIPAEAVSGKDGNLRVTLQVAGFTPKGDSRELGFVLFGAKLEPLGGGWTVPPPLQIGWMLGTMLLLYALLARAGFAAWRASAATFGLALVPAYVLATPGARIWLTVYSSQVAFAFGWALLMVVLLDIPMRRVWEAGWERRWVLSIFGLTLALRLTGLLHPQSGPSITDLGFHLHRYADLWQGGQWWYKITSAEWGNRDTYYPLTVYLLMGPFNWLFGGDTRLMQIFWIATFESSRVLLVYYLVKKATGEARSAVIAAFFMAALPVGMLSVAWGQVANLFGEWLILVALCLVVVKWEKLRHPAYFLTLAITILATFIVHPGEVLLSGLAFLALGLVLWLSRGSRKQARIMLAAFLLAVVLSFASYHWVTVQTMVPQALDSLNAKLHGGTVSKESAAKCNGTKVSGQVEDARLGLPKQCIQGGLADILPEGLKTYWREIRIYFAVFPVLMLPWGLWWLWRTSRPSAGPEAFEKYAGSRRRLFWAGIVWTAIAVLFALVGLLVNLYVRYQLFMLPIVAIGAGLFLGQLWQRLDKMGRGGVAAFLTFALGAWVALGTLALFLDRMIYFAHG